MAQAGDARITLELANKQFNDAVKESVKTAQSLEEAVRRVNKVVEDFPRAASSPNKRSFQTELKRVQEQIIGIGKTPAEQMLARGEIAAQKYAGDPARATALKTSYTELAGALQRSAESTKQMAEAEANLNRAKQQELATQEKINKLQREAAVYGKKGVELLEARRGLALRDMGADPEKVKQVNASFAAMIDQQRKLDAQMEATRVKGQGIVGMFGNWTNAIKNTGLAIVGFRVISGLLSLPELLASTTNRFQQYEMSLRAVSRSSADAAYKLRELRNVASSPGLTLDTTIRGVVRLQAAGIGFEESVRMVKAFGNALAIVGGTTEDLQGVIIALTQIAATPFVQGDEIRQLQERLPQIRMLMIQAFGTSRTEEIKKLGISSAEFLKAITRGAEGLGGATNTLSVAWQHLKDEISGVFSTVFRPAVNLLTTSLQQQADGLKTVRTAATDAKVALTELFTIPPQAKAYGFFQFPNLGELSENARRFHAGQLAGQLQMLGLRDLDAQRKGVDDLADAMKKLREYRRLGVITEAEAVQQELAYRGTLEALNPLLAVARKNTEALADARRRVTEDIREGAAAAEKKGLTGFAADVAALNARIQGKLTYETVDAFGRRQTHALKLSAEEIAKYVKEYRKLFTNAQVEIRRENYKAITQQIEATNDQGKRERELRADALKELLSMEDEKFDEFYRMRQTALQQQRDLEISSARSMQELGISAKVVYEGRKLDIERDFIQRSLALQLEKSEREQEIELWRVVQRSKIAGETEAQLAARLSQLDADYNMIRSAARKKSESDVGEARYQAATNVNQMLLSEESKLRNSIKAGWEQTFDALTVNFRGWGNLWKQILNASLLTPIKKFAAELFTSFTMPLAHSLRSALSGAGASAGFGARGLGGFASAAAGLPSIGLSGIGGWGGGLGGWGGGVSGAGVGTLAQGGLLASGARFGKWPAFSVGALGLGGGLLGMFGAYKAGQSQTPWLKYAAPGIGAISGMIGFSALQMMFPALLAAGPFGLLAAAAIGATIGMVGMWRKSAESRVIEKVKDAYSITIDRQFARTIVEMAKSQYGGNIDMAIRTQEIRDLILLYGMSTNQNKGLYDDRPRGVHLQQAGGSLQQIGLGGYGYSSSIIPSISGLRPYMPTPSPVIINNISLNVDGAAASSYFEGKTLTFVQSNAGAIQSANESAWRQSKGRSSSQAIILDPLAAGV